MNIYKTHIDAKIIGFSTVAAVLGATFAIAMSASAAGEPLERNGWREGCDPEHHAAVEEALQSHDYEAWKELMGDRGHMAALITEDNFDTFVAMHTALEEGDRETAQELRTELGLPTHMHTGDEFGRRHGERGMGRVGRHMQ